MEFVSEWPLSLPAGQVLFGPHFRGLPLDGGAGEESLRRRLWLKRALLHQNSTRGAEGQIKSFSAPALGAEVERRSSPLESLSPARVGTSRPEPFPGRHPASNARLRTVGGPASTASGPQGAPPPPLPLFPVLSGRVCFLFPCPTTILLTADPTRGNGTEDNSGPGFEFCVYL